MRAAGDASAFPAPRPQPSHPLLPRRQECAAPDEVTQAVLRLNPAKLKPFPKGDASGIVAAIDALTGKAAGGGGGGSRAAARAR